jgi:hypothetical protein
MLCRVLVYHLHKFIYSKETLEDLEGMTVGICELLRISGLACYSNRINALRMESAKLSLL